MNPEILSGESRRIINDTIRANLLNEKPHVYNFDLPEGKLTVNGHVMLTRGVQRLGEEIPDLLKLFRDQKEFDPGNDPYGEHDFIIVHHKDIKYYGKFDYYDRNLKNLGSDDFVLTLMQASEY